MKTDKTRPAGASHAEALRKASYKLTRAKAAQIAALIQQWHPQYRMEAFWWQDRRGFHGPDLPQPSTSLALWREEVDDAEVARGGFFGFRLEKRATWHVGVGSMADVEALAALVFFRALEGPHAAVRVAWTLTLEVSPPWAMRDYRQPEPKPRYIDVTTGCEWIPECWRHHRVRKPAEEARAAA